MPKGSSDPLEERDIQKILSALDDDRVVLKIANALAISKMNVLTKSDVENQEDISMEVNVIVPKSTIKEE